MFYQPGNMAVSRVVVCPVNNTAFFVPLILTLELNRIPCFQTFDSRCQIDIVTEQHRFSGTEHEYESLMS